ncbi:hypothetical protein K503DRAFT_740181 [Rhizopogon vinicolor AM-OR11-026]|uniref:Uncharacterized protein n=1 Tax=Rhizopogon vinicolor AM-OR11-026 TaxID=1314800 RepID=A0A1B7N2I3_9AGAM|nr:hypothetical protein K503DRAFT_740181 [Rhizopogon vinicolor AM-OR11-026]
MLCSTPMGFSRPRILHFEDLHYLLRLVHHRPDWFFDEMLDLLDDNRLVAVHFSTIYRELVRAGISCKRLKKIARERNEEHRADFIRRMAQYVVRSIRYCNHHTQSSWD